MLKNLLFSVVIIAATTTSASYAQESVISNMESYEISLNGESITVTPQYDESYLLSSNNINGIIIPEYVDGNLKWVPLSLISGDIAEQIGELIERRDM